MIASVIDASVGIKWYVPELYDVDARRLQAPFHELHVPTLWDVETANILWKKKQRGELSRADADEHNHNKGSGGYLCPRVAWLRRARYEKE